MFETTHGIVFATVVRQSVPGVVEHEHVFPADVVDAFVTARIQLRRTRTAAHQHAASFRGDRLLAQYPHLKIAKKNTFILKSEKIKYK